MRRGEKFLPLANCHVKGLFSIPLEQNDTYVRRMFIDTLGLTRTVAPHSHRYPLVLEMVHGEMNHSVWYPATLGAIEMWSYRWVSPVSETILKFSGEEAVTITEPGYFECLDAEPKRYNLENARLNATIRPLELSSSRIHSLVTTPGASWIITEYLDDNPNPIALHSYPTYAPDLSGLYVPIEV